MGEAVQVELHVRIMIGASWHLASTPCPSRKPKFVGSRLLEGTTSATASLPVPVFLFSLSPLPLLSVDGSTLIAFLWSLCFGVVHIWRRAWSALGPLRSTPRERCSWTSRAHRKGLGLLNLGCFVCFRFSRALHSQRSCVVGVQTAGGGWARVCCCIGRLQSAGALVDPCHGFLSS